MPQTIDLINFPCGPDTTQWPKLSCTQPGQLALDDADLHLEENRELFFQDNGQIRVFDDNHKLFFDRTNDRLELYESGDIRFLTGVPTPTEKLRIRADGTVGIGTESPAATLHVVGDLRTDGSLTVANTTNLNANLNVAGTTSLGSNTGVQGNLQVTGVLDAAEIRQGGVPLVSSQWDNVAGGLNFAGGNVGIGTTNPLGKLQIEGSSETSPGLVIKTTDTREWNMAMRIEGQAGTERAIGFYTDDTPEWWFGRNNSGPGAEGLGFWRGGVGYALILKDNGNVGVGTTTPATTLDVRGQTNTHVLQLGDKFRLSGIGDGHGNDGWLRFFNVQNTGYYGGIAAGRVYAATGRIEGSDIRQKENIVAMNNSLNKIMALQGVLFNWKGTDSKLGTQMGLIAQQVELVFPELVEVGPDGLKAINYSGLIAPLIEALKEQQDHIEWLTLEVERIKFGSPHQL